jgi:hypothetical protein
MAVEIPNDSSRISSSALRASETPFAEREPSKTQAACGNYMKKSPDFAVKSKIARSLLFPCRREIRTWDPSSIGPSYQAEESVGKYKYLIIIKTITKLPTANLRSDAFSYLMSFII